MKGLFRRAVVVVVLIVLVAIATAYMSSVQSSRNTTEDYALWVVYLLLLILVGVFLLGPLNAALNVITERIAPHI